MNAPHQTSRRLFANEETPPRPRGIPPRPAIAWFLRDLVPDEFWKTFDLGIVRDGDIGHVRDALMQHGGRDAWLRFLAQTRDHLPQILSVSLYDVLAPELRHREILPRDVTYICYPTLSVYAGGRLLQPKIRLTCQARLSFRDAGRPHVADYALVDTEVALKQKHHCVIERVRGSYFVPVPLPDAKRRRAGPAGAEAG